MRPSSEPGARARPGTEFQMVTFRVPAGLRARRIRGSGRARSARRRQAASGVPRPAGIGRGVMTATAPTGAAVGGRRPRRRPGSRRRPRTRRRPPRPRPAAGSRSRRGSTMVRGREVVQRMPGQVVVAVGGGQLPEDALAERGRVRGVVDTDPQVDPRRPGAVDDLGHHDLAVDVAGEVDRAGQLVAQPLQRRPGVGDAAGRRSVLADEVDAVPEHVRAVVQALEPALVGAGAQEVVGRGQGEAGRRGRSPWRGRGPRVRRRSPGAGAPAARTG